MLQDTRRDIHGAALSRRQLFKGSGALLVGFGLVASGVSRTVTAATTGLDPTQARSWVEVRADNTILLRTGNSDFGQGTVYTAYRQIVADELYTTVEAITSVVTGDTDRTPDGGGSYQLLLSGWPNVRKAAAYTYQALLDLAVQALGAPRTAITAEDGVFHGGGKSVSYGDLVKHHELKLTIPVKDMGSIGLLITGDPPTKPVSEYKHIGKSFDNSAIVTRVTARETWITDVRLPGMLHARIVRPKTLGSTLVAPGKLDAARFPGAQLVVKGNLVAVVSPSEWDAIRGAQLVAATTQWTDWQGLPGSDHLPDALRAADWAGTEISTQGFFAGPAQPADAPERAEHAIAGAAHTFKATYFLPYLKHAPIGPTIAVADVRPDGMTYIHAHNQNAQLLRQAIARMLGVSKDAVVVRSYPGPGHYGRSNNGVSGGEDEAVILSKELGRPVRVQWMRAEDIQWSTQQAAAFSDIQAGLDAQGRLIGYQSDHYMPAMNDARPIGAVLAGLPTLPAPSPASSDFATSTKNRLWDPWIYDGVADYAQIAHGAPQIGEAHSPLQVGIRDQSMRTPAQFQQNFPREAAINEIAALAGADAIQFRLDHTVNLRVKGVLEAVRDASGWQARPSPAPGQSGDVARGRGVAALFREGSYWACVAEVAVTRSTGVVKVEKVTVAVDPGIVINPKQLKRQVEGGSAMGVSQALFEEVQFDQSGITSDDWRSYPILTMADLPEINVVLLNRPEVGAYGSGSEAANALPAAAIVAAFHDATGAVARRLPLSPQYVLPLLKT